MITLSIRFGIEDPINFCFHPLEKASGNNVAALFYEVMSHNNAGLVDVYPINDNLAEGFDITRSIDSNLRKKIPSHLREINKLDPYQAYIRCLVIDFKDKDGKYLRVNEIWKGEQAFLDFFRDVEPQGKKKSSRLEIYNLIKTNNIKFIINEGCLKADLIQRVFKDKSDFFHTVGDKLLCQFCEILMNGFKQGYKIGVKNFTFDPDNYIRAINPTQFEWENRPPLKLFLITLYPKKYWEVYSENSAYIEAIKNTFKERIFIKDEIKIITLERV